MDTLPSLFTHQFIPAPAEKFDAPTLLLLHGTGGTEKDLLDLGRTLGPTANLLSPRGRVMENGMPRFFRRLAEGVFDLDDLAKRTDELAEFVGQAVGHYKLEPRKLLAVGYSNGANMAVSLLLRHPAALAGAVLFRPMLPYRPETLPDLRKKTIAVLSGRRDPLTPMKQVEALVKLLKEAGAEVVHHSHPDAGHGLTRPDLAAAESWCRDLWSKTDA